jgi:hypothetical protein
VRSQQGDHARLEELRVLLFGAHRPGQLQAGITSPFLRRLRPGGPLAGEGERQHAAASSPGTVRVAANECVKMPARPLAVGIGARALEEGNLAVVFGVELA